jgi:hypothetical protein
VVVVVVEGGSLNAWRGVSGTTAALRRAGAEGERKVLGVFDLIRAGLEGELVITTFLDPFSRPSWHYRIILIKTCSATIKAPFFPHHCTSSPSLFAFLAYYYLKMRLTVVPEPPDVGKSFIPVELIIIIIQPSIGIAPTPI